MVVVSVFYMVERQLLFDVDLYTAVSGLTDIDRVKVFYMLIACGYSSSSRHREHVGGIDE